MCLVSDHEAKLFGLRPGWLLPPRLNVISSLHFTFAHLSLISSCFIGILLPLIIKIKFDILIYQDVSDAQWRNFRANLPILTLAFGLVAMLANTLRAFLSLKAKGLSIAWLFISLPYLCYLHGAW